MGLRHLLTPPRRSRRATLGVSTTVGAVLALVPFAAEAAESPSPEVVIVGDSITADLVDVIRSDLTAAGHGSVAYAALGARRIEVSYEWHGWRNSGVDEIAALKAAGVDPELWVVELGTNDLPWIAADSSDPIESATDLIDTVLETIGPDARVAWVTVLNHDDDRSSRSFNTALRRAAEADPRLDLVDWYAFARERADWFRDAVHPNEAGARALAGLYTTRLEAPRPIDGDVPTVWVHRTSSRYLSYR